MKKINAKSVAIGIILGSMMTAGVGYAASTLTQISVDLDPILIKINDKLVEESGKNTFKNGGENVPLSMVYKNTTYVPLRFINEALDKKTEWDGKTRTIIIKDITTGKIVDGSITSALSYDEKGLLVFIIKNQLDKEQTLRFNTGQKYDYIIKNDNGEKIQQYSFGKLFKEMVMTEVIKPGEEKVYTAPLNKLKKGHYQAEFWLATSNANLRQTISFDVTQDMEQK
jgi:hypothetical protein